MQTNASYIALHMCATLPTFN